MKQMSSLKGTLKKMCLSKKIFIKQAPIRATQTTLRLSDCGTDAKKRVPMKPRYNEVNKMGNLVITDKHASLY